MNLNYISNYRYEKPTSVNVKRGYNYLESIYDRITKFGTLIILIFTRLNTINMLILENVKICINCNEYKNMKIIIVGNSCK